MSLVFPAVHISYINKFIAILALEADAVQSSSSSSKKWMYGKFDFLVGWSDRTRSVEKLCGNFPPSFKSRTNAEKPGELGRKSEALDAAVGHFLLESLISDE